MSDAVPVAAPVIWSPDRSDRLAGHPPMGTALWRGATGCCPACGEGKLFAGFLRVAPECTACHTPLGQLRADDLPPYVTIMIVGHFIVPMMLWVEKSATPPLWVHSAIWLPLTLGLTLGLIRPVKGAVVGLMLRLGMIKQEGDA